VELAWSESPATRETWPSVLLLGENGDVATITPRQELTLPLAPGLTLALCFNMARAPLSHHGAFASAQEVADFIAHSTARDERDDRRTQCVLVLRSRAVGLDAAGTWYGDTAVREVLPDSVFVVSCAGEIVLYTAAELKQALEDAFEHGPRCLDLDVSE